MIIMFIMSFSDCTLCTFKLSLSLSALFLLLVLMSGSYENRAYFEKVTGGLSITLLLMIMKIKRANRAKSISELLSLSIWNVIYLQLVI